MSCITAIWRDADGRLYFNLVGERPDERIVVALSYEKIFLAALDVLL